MPKGVGCWGGAPSIVRPGRPILVVASFCPTSVTVLVGMGLGIGGTRATALAITEPGPETCCAIRNGTLVACIIQALPTDEPWLQSATTRVDVVRRLLQTWGPGVAAAWSLTNPAPAT